MLRQLRQKLVNWLLRDAHIEHLEVGENTVSIDSNNITLPGTVDGIDVSAHAANADAHHVRSHDHSLAADGSPIALAGIPSPLTGKVVDTLADGAVSTVAKIAAGIKDVASGLPVLDASTLIKSAQVPVITDTQHGSRGSGLHTDSHARSHDHSNALDGSPIAVAGVPSLDAAKITTGRFGVARMPDGTSGYFLKAQGAGVDPAYAAVAVPTIVRKTADEIVNNSIILQNDDHLFFAIAANEVWEFTFVIRACNAGGLAGTADIKFAIVTPTAAVGKIECTNLDAVDTFFYSQVLLDGTAIPVGFLLSAGTVYQITLHGVVINSTTAGNLQLKWAQNTAEVSSTTVKANSCLIAHKLA